MRSMMIREFCAKAAGEAPAPAAVEEQKTAAACDDLVGDIDAALAADGQTNNRAGKIALAKLLAAADVLAQGS